MLTKNDGPSYFIECLIYNVLDGLFKPKLVPTYAAIVDWLKTADFQGFKCQNGRVDLFGSGKEQWSVKKARGVRQSATGVVGRGRLRTEATPPTDLATTGSA